MCQEGNARLRVLALADIAEFEQPRRAVAICNRAGCDLDRDGRTVAVGDVGIEPQLSFAEQPLDGVRVGDERGDHQVRDVFALHADEAAKAGVHRDRLHAGAHRDALIQHIEQRIEAARPVRGVAAPAPRNTSASPKPPARTTSGTDSTLPMAAKACAGASSIVPKAGSQPHNRTPKDRYGGGCFTRCLSGAGGITSPSGRPVFTSCDSKPGTPQE